MLKAKTASGVCEAKVGHSVALNACTDFVQSKLYENEVLAKFVHRQALGQCDLRNRIVYHSFLLPPHLSYVGFLFLQNRHRKTFCIGLASHFAFDMMRKAE